jgi:hypothetical protein
LGERAFAHAVVIGVANVGQVIRNSWVASFVEALARQARRLGRTVMAGNIVGTTLAMAPSFLVVQLRNIEHVHLP